MIEIAGCAHAPDEGDANDSGQVTPDPHHLDFIAALSPHACVVDEPRQLWMEISNKHLPDGRRMKPL